jgi:hypothetical protein
MITLQEEPFLLGLLFVLIYCVVTVLGLVVALIAWAGARAGTVVGALILLVGVANLVYTLLTPWPRLWWVSIGPIYAGWLAMSAWRGRGGSLQRLSFRFRLRGLMLLVAVCAIVIGGIMAYYRGERYEQQVLAPLRGIVDVQRTAFGRADFVILHAENEKKFKEAMAALAQLDQMRSLQVNESNVPPDAAMRQFAQLTSLRWLLLQRLPVADADLEPLRNLERLEMLELDGSRLSDAGLVYLYPLKRLNKLYLYGADPQKVSAQGLKRLHAELPNLLPGYP